jgi:ATP-binding cassette subfamily A (ABC1) protein 3
LYVQQAVDSAFKHLLGVNVSTETIELSRFPYPTYIDDVFLVALQGFLPLIIVFSFIYSVINITKSVAHEKEKRLKVH